jgi:predicted dehydrogenase
MINLAIIGTGFISHTHAASARDLPDVRLHAVYSRSEDRARQFAEQYDIPRTFTDYATLLAEGEIDAVIIGLPTPLHREFTEQATAAGKHILCEKPVALTLEDTDAMIAACDQADVILMIAHVLRFWPEYVSAKTLVDNGVFGPVRAVSAHRLNIVPQWSAGGWLLDPQQSGGVPVDLHIHDLDIICWFLGSPMRLTARGLQTQDGLVKEVISLLEFPDGRIAYAEAGFLLPEGDSLKMDFRIICEKGVIEYSNQSQPTLRAFQAGKPVSLPPLPQEDGYTAQLRYFAECVQSGKSPERMPPAAARLALQLALEAKSQVEATATKRS